MLSIIIPVLNEAQSIVSVLAHLTKNASAANRCEIILVDGGSTDATHALIEQFAANSHFSIQLVVSEKGRAKQMNTGARNAKGNIFYFLHADSYPPKDFDTFILAEIEGGNPAGCFSMRFDSTHWWLRLAGWFTKLSWRACRGGDQSQFITKDLFEAIGGYDETFTIYEDNILINELYKRKKYVVIQEPLISSARLYRDKGIWYVQYHFCAIYVKRWLGADADSLYAYYKKHIGKNQTSQQVKTQNASQVLADK